MYRTLIICVCCIVTGAVSALEADWQFAKEKHGVAVQTAEIPGSKFLAFKAVSHIAASVDDVLRVLVDHENYPEWYFNCERIELLERRDGDDALVRVVIKTPFPLANRDAVNVVTVQRTAYGALVRLESEPDLAPPAKGLVRMRTAAGAWELRADAAGTQVTHYYHADPKVTAPAWLVNRFVVDGPISSLSRLRERVLAAD